MRTSKWIRGELWQFIVLTRAVYDRQENESLSGDEKTSEGVTYPHNKVYFRLCDFDEDLVGHEMLHAFSFTRAVDQAKETAEDREEGLALLFQKHRKRYMQLVSEVYKELQSKIDKRYP